MNVSLIQVPYMMGGEHQGKGPERLVQAGAERIVAAKGVAVTVERIDRAEPFRDSGNASWLSARMLQQPADRALKEVGFLLF
jgi:hypothetical protein